MVGALAEHSRSAQDRDVSWALLVLEFRIHAARTEGLDRRFGEVHRRSLDLLMEIFDELASRTGVEIECAAPDLARFVMALESGSVLERLVDGPGLVAGVARPALERVLGLSRDPGRGDVS